MEDTLNRRNYNSCICQCHFPTTLCYHMECCCPCVYYIHETNSNINPNFYSLNDLQPLLISKKEKKIFQKNYKKYKHHYLSTPRHNINNNFPDCENKMNSFNLSQLKNIKPNLDIEEENNNKIKPKYNNKDNQEKKDKSINSNGGNKINYHLFKKIKFKKNKQERAITCPTSNIINSKIKKKVMNNCIPFNHNKIFKPRYFNKFELKQNEYKKRKRIFINKKSFDCINYNNRLNLTNYENTFLSENKFKMEDQNDDILEIKKQNFSIIENNDNKIALQNLNKEIDKAKLMINNLKKENKDLNSLKTENEKLKKILFLKKQKKKLLNEQKLNKGTNTSIYDDMDFGIQKNKEKEEKEEKDLIQKKLFQKEIINLKNEISEITYKLNEYEKYIVSLKKKNIEQENIIKNKDKEILDLIAKLGNIENENKYKLNELNIKNDEIMKESQNISSDLKISNDNLKLEIQKLKEILMNKNSQIKELEIKLKYEKKFDSKKQKLLELLFNFYLNIKKIINFEKSKETLKDVIEVMNLDDFQIKLNKVEKKFTQIIDDIQIKYGHCFACDIACCTSHVDKLKTFRKANLKKK